MSTCAVLGYCMSSSKCPRQLAFQTKFSNIWKKPDTVWYEVDSFTENIQSTGEFSINGMGRQESVFFKG